jgi:hypothetical protein
LQLLVPVEVGVWSSKVSNHGTKGKWKQGRLEFAGIASGEQMRSFALM